MFSEEPLTGIELFMYQLHLFVFYSLFVISLFSLGVVVYKKLQKKPVGKWIYIFLITLILLTLYLIKDYLDFKNLQNFINQV